MSDNNISYELQQIQSTLAALTERLAASTATQIGGMQMYIAVGWSPIIALTDDGTYYYAQIIDWTGGSGIKPPVLQYLCETGWTYNVAEAARVGIVGGGIPDGDKGDITVASGVWTIDNGVVTTAKMGGDVTTAGKAMLTAADAAAQLSLIGAAAASHTHNVSDLLQSGATTNQILQWNGTAWVPVTFSGGIGGTLGSTDNALIRADGTGGATAQGSGVTVSDAGQITGPFWGISTATYSGRTYTVFKAIGTNVAVQLCPTGTGNLTAHLPDGTATGGNARGATSVDWQMSRASAFRVASGESSVVGGGYNNGATGRWATVPGGAGNSASGESSIAAGEGCTSSGQRSVALNSYCAASAYASLASGAGSSATLYGQRTHSSAGATRAQLSDCTLHRDTTDATPSNLFLDNSSARLVVPASSSGCAMISVTARTATAGAETMTWRRRVNWQRGVSVGTVTVDVETMGTDRGYTGGAWGAGPAWTLAITADTTNGAINVIGTGAAATNIRWGASVEWIETTFA